MPLLAVVIAFIVGGIPFGYLLVRLKTGRRVDRDCDSSRASAPCATTSGLPAAAAWARARASVARTAFTAAGRPKRSMACPAVCVRSTSSTEGSLGRAHASSAMTGSERGGAAQTERRKVWDGAARQDRSPTMLGKS